MSQDNMPNIAPSALTAKPKPSFNPTPPPGLEANNRKPFLALLALLAAILFYLCSYVVEQSKYAVVFALGEIKEVVDQPGLHFKLPAPLQNVVLFERRILTIDTPDSERVQTSEKKNLQVDSFVKWRILDPKAFYVSFGGKEAEAEARITTLVRDAMNQAINKRTVNDVTSRERDKIMEEIRSSVQERLKAVGVEVVDVRLKRVDFVPEISESVFNRMTAERKRVANEQRSSGAAEGEKIRAEAERERDQVLAEAYRKAQVIKGEGDGKASAIYAASFGANPEFYSFYRSLEAYRASFKNKQDVMVVDPASDFFKYFRSAGGAAASPNNSKGK
jgi:membrane protease subunit HflC